MFAYHFVVVELLAPGLGTRSFPFRAKSFFSVLFENVTFFSVLFGRKKNGKNVTFFLKERKRTERTLRSFWKNGKERKERYVPLKGMEQNGKNGNRRIGNGRNVTFFSVLFSALFGQKKGIFFAKNSVFSTFFGRKRKEKKKKTERSFSVFFEGPERK